MHICPMARTGPNPQDLQNMRKKQLTGLLFLVCSVYMAIEVRVYKEQ